MTVTRPPSVEQRATERSYLHRLDSEYAWILSRSGEFKARVLDITPKGIGLVLEGASARLPLLISKGDLVPIRVERGGQAVTVKARLATRNETVLEKDSLRLGFRIESDDEALLEEITKREGRIEEPRPHRFSLKDAPLLECESDDLSREGQKAFYKIRDLSLKGALLETSARNKFLLPNLKLELAITIPGHGRFQEEIVIHRVQAARDRYLVGIEFLDLQPETVRSLGDYCVNFAKDVSFQIMLEEGFPAHVLEDSLTVQAMASQQDFMQITQLRLQTEHKRGRGLALSDPWSMMDESDTEARHVSVKLGKRVVASARLLEKGDDTVSVSRLVIDTDFSRAVKASKIEGVLWQEIFKTALLSGRSYLGVEGPDAPAAFLKELGLRAVPGEGGHRLNLRHLQIGKDARFVTWSRRVAPVLESNGSGSKLTITRSLALKIFLARFFRPQWENPS